MEIEIRPFTMADYDAVRQLWEICHIRLGPQDSREEIQKKLERDRDLFLVAVANQVIMGAVIGAWDGRNGWMYNHAVDPRSRRLGLGTRLLTEMERRFKELGALQACFLVKQSDFENQGFYEGISYRQDEDTIVMVKSFKENKGAC